MPSNKQSYASCRMFSCIPTSMFYRCHSNYMIDEIPVAVSSVMKVMMMMKIVMMMRRIKGDAKGAGEQYSFRLFTYIVQKSLKSPDRHMILRKNFLLGGSKRWANISPITPKSSHV